MYAALRAVALVVVGVAVTRTAGLLAGSSTELSALGSLQLDSAAYFSLASAQAKAVFAGAVPWTQPPGFISTLALLFWLWGPSVVAAKVLLFVSWCASIALAGWLSNRMWGSPAGWVAGLLTASSPALSWYTTTIQYEVLCAAQLSSAVALAWSAAHARDAKRRLWCALAAGGASGYLALTRETFVFVGPLCAIWLVARLRTTTSRSQVLSAALVLLLASLGPVSMWSAIQSVRAERVLIISDKASVNMAIGNNPLASGMYMAVIGTPAGFRFIAAQPIPTSRLWLRKALYFWGVLRDTWNVPRPSATFVYAALGGLVPMEWLLALARGGWLLAGFAGACWYMAASHRWAQSWLVPTTVLVLFAVHVVAMSSHRFAVPILPLVYTMISGPATALLRGAFRGTYRPVAALGSLAAVSLCGFLLTGRIATDYTYQGGDIAGSYSIVTEVDGRRAALSRQTDGRQPTIILADEYMPVGNHTLLVSVKQAGCHDPNAHLADLRIFVGDRMLINEQWPCGLVTSEVTPIIVPFDKSGHGLTTIVLESMGAADLICTEVSVVNRTRPAVAGG